VSQAFRFGRVEVRPGERLLLIDGEPAALGSRAFDVLLVLVDHRDRLVGKHELLDRVWPGLVVEENNLMVQVSALRKLLGPGAIATIPGRGYRFTLAGDGVAASASAAPAPRFEPIAALPALPSALHGRDDDLAEIDQWLSRQRLLTMTGAGGIGKTTLALAAAHARRGTVRDGVAWVALGDIADPSLVASAVTQVLGLPASARDDPLPALAAALAARQMLIVLDSAEHLLDAVARLVRAVLSQAAGVQFLVTSQAALKLDGERVFHLGALSVPPAGTPPAQALGYGAVALFVDQAQAAERHFSLNDSNVDAVVEMCRQLDGLALAIKLAAARLPLLGLAGLAARLGDRLKLLGGTGRGAPTRQQTLRAALDWSHSLLGTVEQVVFRRLGVFAGGFTLELASAVASDDTLDEWAVIDALGSLVDRSLVTLDAGELPRYRLPQGPREYAHLQAEKAGERQAVQRRHAQALAAHMDRAYEAYWEAPDQAWLAAHGVEIDNLRAALDWSTAHEPALGVRLIGAASFLFLMLGLAPEARKRSQGLEEAAGAAAPPDAARYWRERSRLHWGVSNARMAEFARASAALCRAAGDERGLYLALRCAAGSGAVPAEEAEAMLAEMARLEQPAWPPRLRAQRRLAELGVLRSAGRLDEVRNAAQALLAMSRQAAMDSNALVALATLASVHLTLGDADAALSCAREVIDGRTQRRDNFVLQALASMTQALLARGDLAAARAALADFIATSRSRDWEWFDLYADLFALLAAKEGRLEAAARLIGHADAAGRRVGARDPNMARARAEALAIVEGALEPERVARGMAEGAPLGIEAVRALALAEVEA
jgi:predicted ATPase/DNA-binding winged helix-turn-helix (wHTH) protein